MASVPTRRAPAVPSTRRSTSIVFIGFQVRPNRFSRGMSSGIPSSQVLSRWMDPVERTSMQAGPNVDVPAVQRVRVPVT